MGARRKREDETQMSAFGVGPMDAQEPRQMLFGALLCA